MQPSRWPRPPKTPTGSKSSGSRGWSDDTSRIDGMLSLALRKKEVVLKAVKAMHKAKEIDSYYEVSKWLNSHYKFLTTP